MTFYDVIDGLTDEIRNDVGITIRRAMPFPADNIKLKNDLLIMDVAKLGINSGTVRFRILVPFYSGSEHCFELTRRVISTINHNSNLNFYYNVGRISYDSKFDTYYQECHAYSKFLDEKNKDSGNDGNSSAAEQHNKLKIDNLSIKVNNNTVVKITNRLEVIHSPIIGTYVENLGNDLRRIEGSAAMSENTLKEMLDLFKKNKVHDLEFKGQKFKASLKSIKISLSNKIEFIFIEFVS